jgi:hypothetical protein
MAKETKTEFLLTARCPECSARIGIFRLLYGMITAKPGGHVLSCGACFAKLKPTIPLYAQWGFILVFFSGLFIGTENAGTRGSMGFWGLAGYAVLLLSGFLWSLWIVLINFGTFEIFKAIEGNRK